MQINESDIKAEVYFEKDNVFYVKVSFLGMFISGITVRESIKYKESGLWVQMPSYSSGGQWKKYIEFKPASPLKEIIHNKSSEAVEKYKSERGANAGEIDVAEIF